MASTVTVSSFRGNFTEFGDIALYPNSLIAYWISIAVLLMNESRWQTLLDHGVSLFVAHNIALEAIARAEAVNGAPPGGTVGPINNKSVDKVSIGYDTSAGIEEGAGHWNNTIYGTRFIRMAKMMGAGPVQIGIVACSPGPLSSVNAWTGPDCMPGFTNFS